MTNLHFDFGVDLNGTDILDNFYLGIGAALARNIHFTGGYRLGFRDRVDLDLVNPTTLNTDGLMRRESYGSFYFGINLGLDIVPAFIKSIVQ